MEKQRKEREAMYLKKSGCGIRGRVWREEKKKQKNDIIILWSQNRMIENRRNQCSAGLIKMSSPLIKERVFSSTRGV